MKKYFKIIQGERIVIYNLVGEHISGIVYSNEIGNDKEYYDEHKDWKPWGCVDNRIKEIISLCKIHESGFSIIETNDIESEIFLECL